MTTRATRTGALILTLALLVIACEEDRIASLPAERAVDAPVGGVAEPRIARAEAFDESARRERMLIRGAQILLEVADVDTAAARIRLFAADVGGRVEGLEETAGARETRRLAVSLRVPEARLDDAIAHARALGELERISLSEREVTEEAEDLDVRLRNLRRLEERLLRILDERTGDLEDVLAVERELARVRQEIESRESRLRRLEQEAAWSVLRIDVHEPYPLSARTGNGVFARLGRAFIQAGDNFFDFVLVVIAGLGYMIPLALLAWAAVWLVRRIRRRWAAAATDRIGATDSASN